MGGGGGGISKGIGNRKWFFLSDHYKLSLPSNRLYGQTDLATIYTKSDADAMDLSEYYAWVCWSNNNFLDLFRGQCHPDEKRTCGAVHSDSGRYVRLLLILV